MQMDIMDSRNLQERIDELEKTGVIRLGEIPQNEEPEDREESGELENLLNLKEETESSGWEYGIFFIAENDFEEYAQEFAEGIGAISSDAQWPLSHIDWEAAANDLRSDYSEVEYNGTTYLYREA